MTLEFDLRRDVLLAFVTPIAQIRLGESAEINPLLAEAIRDKAARVEGQVRSNVGGWHSQDDLLTWPGEAVAALGTAFHEAVDHMMALVTQRQSVETTQTTKAWANICRSGDYHLPHSHATYHWSGVYYVDAGQPAPDHPQSGVLEFQDPRGAVEMAGTPANPFGRTVPVTPTDGTMVVFPSWLTHWVRAYQGPGERISIAFNTRVDNLKRG